jgi:hypothetical protein
VPGSEERRRRRDRATVPPQRRPVLRLGALPMREVGARWRGVLTVFLRTAYPRSMHAPCRGSSRFWRSRDRERKEVNPAMAGGGAGALQAGGPGTLQAGCAPSYPSTMRKSAVDTGRRRSIAAW